MLYSSPSSNNTLANSISGPTVPLDVVEAVDAEALLAANLPDVAEAAEADGAAPRSASPGSPRLIVR